MRIADFVLPLHESAIRNPQSEITHGAVQVDVLPPGQLGMEAGAHLQQGAHPPVDLGAALRRLGDAGEDLEQRRLPRSVAANACPEPVEGMPTTSPRCTSKETSVSAQIVSLATADDWPRTTEVRRRKGAWAASVSDSRMVL